MKNIYTNIRGFTLVEILVVLAIISILASVVMASVSDARENARDKKRIADLGQIQLALKLYQVENGHYPKQSEGFSGSASFGKICAGCTGPINDTLRRYLGSVPIDPLDRNDFYYWYDGDQNCGGNPGQVVIAARTMETEKYKNTSDTICTSWGGEGGIGKADSHNIVLGPAPAP
jgi:general secretion pathway protein G